MKFPLLAILALHAAALAAPVVKISNFELTDQESKPRTYRFPKAKVTVMTVADHKGSEQLASWIQPIRDRYQTRIDIDGIADVSIVPKVFHGMIRDTFRKKLTYSVMLDWDGAVVKQFAYKKGVANIYLVARTGHILKQFTGPMTEEAMESLIREVDVALAGRSRD